MFSLRRLAVATVLVVAGDIEGCWYTKIVRAWDLGPPSGLYFEIGREVFVGRIHGGAAGTFSTTYTFGEQPPLPRRPDGHDGAVGIAQLERAEHPERHRGAIVAAASIVSGRRGASRTRRGFRLR